MPRAPCVSQRNIDCRKEDARLGARKEPEAPSRTPGAVLEIHLGVHWGKIWLRRLERLRLRPCCTLYPGELAGPGGGGERVRAWESKDASPSKPTLGPPCRWPDLSPTPQTVRKTFGSFRELLGFQPFLRPLNV